MHYSSLQLVKFHQVYKNFGPKRIFEGLSLTVSAGERVAFIGENGSGKTTLARLAAGLETPDQGAVSVAAHCTVGYLAQSTEEKIDPQSTLSELFLDAQGNLHHLSQELRFLEIKMTGPLSEQEASKTYSRWDELHAALLALNGYAALNLANAYCHELGLENIALDRHFSTLSGGEKRRACLAALLLKSPDILILDEPTNHLDGSALEWLEKFLNRYQGAVLLISHDRTFLNRVANGIFELSAATGNVKYYAGNYSAYFFEKERELSQQFEAFQKQKDEITSLKKTLKEQTFSPKKPPPCKDRNKMAYDRRGERHMQSKKRAIDQAKSKLDNLNENKMVNPIPKNFLGITFNPKSFEGNTLISLEKISVIIKNKILLAGVDMQLQPGSRIILDGPNGCGKSTLLRILANRLQPDSGTITYAPHSVIGHLEQEPVFDDPSKTLLEYLQKRFLLPEHALRSLLSQFGLIEGSFIKQFISTLSVGQQRRLQLLELMIGGANVLLLDEPTNHLAPNVIDQLEEALLSFEGAVIAATHDRCFAEKIGTHFIKW